MKVVVDSELCEAHGDCVLVAPEVFDLDDVENVAVVLDPEPSAELHHKVEEAVRLCPVQAIRIEL